MDRSERLIKKILYLALVAMLVFSTLALAGCSGSDVYEDDSATTEETQPAEEAFDPDEQTEAPDVVVDEPSDDDDSAGAVVAADAAGIGSDTAAAGYDAAEVGSDATVGSDVAADAAGDNDEQEYTYVLNTNTKKFHYEDCYSVDQMKDKNKKIVKATRSEVISQGYDPCGNCNP